MTLRPFLPAVAVVSALAVMTSAYQLTLHADPPPQPQPDAERIADELAVEALFVRLAARNLVAREVIAGRTTVPEAAALFAWIDALPPRPSGREARQLAGQAGLPDSGGYTEAELLGVRVVMFVGVAARHDAYPPGCMERARAEFLAARRGGVHPAARGPRRTGARGCWSRPGPRRIASRPLVQMPGGYRRRSDTRPAATTSPRGVPGAVRFS